MRKTQTYIFLTDKMRKLYKRKIVKNVTRFSIIRFIFLHFRYIVRRSGEFFRSIRQELNINWRQGVLRLLLLSEMEKRGYIFVTQITTDTFSQA